MAASPTDLTHINTFNAGVVNGFIFIKKHFSVFPGGGFPVFGQAKPVVTPFGQAMAAPMVSGNPFLVRLLSLFPSLHVNLHFFIILPLTSS